MTEDRQRQIIRDAMQRLLAGTPVRSDGKLTIKSLADEAGVKRWVLTHKHTDLQAEFRDLIAGQGQDPAPVKALRDHITSLTDENNRLRAQLRELRGTCSLLERQIAVQALERARSTAATVTPLTTRPSPRPSPIRPTASPATSGTDRPHA